MVKVVFRRLWFIAFILFFPVALLWPFFAQGKVLFWGAIISQFYPWRSLAVKVLASGAIPLWNHQVGGGAPLLANHQTAVFYPLFVLYLLLPAEVALTLEVALHLFLAGAFTFICARGLGLSRPAASLAGLSYMGSGFLVTRLNFPSMVAAAVWLPLAFWLTHLLLRKGRLPHILALGVILAVQFLAGHVQLWYYTLWLLEGYVLFHLLVERGFRIRALVSIAGALVLGLGLAAVQFLPTLEFALNSQRNTGAEWEFAMTYSLWPWKLLALFVPDLFGNPASGNYWGYANYWEDCGYIGVLPVFLAIVALYRLSRHHTARYGSTGLFLALTVPVSLLLALGKNTPVYPLVFRYVPGFGFFQAPARFIYLYTFAMALLSGIGLDLLQEAPLSPPCLFRLGAVAMGVLTAAVVVRFLPLGIRETFAPAFFTFALLFAGTVFCLGRRSPYREVLALLVAFADLLAFGAGFNPFIETTLYNRATETALFFSQAGGKPFRIYTFGPEEYHIKYERFFRFDCFGPEDIDHWMGLRESQIPQLNMFEGLDHAGVFDPLVVGRYKTLLEIVDRSPVSEALKLLGMLNVRYIISARTIPGLKPIAERGGYWIYENGFFLPRAYVVAALRKATNDEEALAMVTSSGFDPTEEVVLQGPVDFAFQEQSSPEYALQSLQYRPNEIRIEITVESPGYLVLSHTWYPGWRAYVDGKPASLLRADYTLMAVELTQGSHRVVFRYKPLSFYAGAIISFVSLVSVSIGVLTLSDPGLVQAGR